MTAIWRNDGTGWSLLTPVGFEKEEALHTLIERSPHLLPLAGSPRLTIVGREVQIGSGWADLVAVEPAGRIAIIEVKLAKNAEARRAIVAQILAYAAYLHGQDIAAMENDLLKSYLQQQGYQSLADAAAGEQGDDFDRQAFTAGLIECVASGSFRLVLVLDQAPPELVRLVGYLESVTTERLLIDLITISAYGIGGSQILVPQRVEPERPTLKAQAVHHASVGGGETTEGGEAFASAIDTVPSQSQQFARRILAWAKALEAERSATLSTFWGKAGDVTLRCSIPGDYSLVTAWIWKNGALMQLWRSVFNRRAAVSLEHIEKVLGKPVKDGTGVHDQEATPELLSALAAAYREAAAGHIAV